MFTFNLIGFVAEAVAKRLTEGASDDMHYHGFLWKKGAFDTVKEKMASKQLTFGDVVSGALHDFDNANGVDVSIGEHGVHLYGDGKAGKKPLPDGAGQ